MRTIVVGLCIVGVGCGGQALNSPTSPSPAASMSTASLTRVSAASPTSDRLPFRGELTAQETDVVTFPTLLADGEAEGTATHLGRYAATFHATVNVLDGTATGTYTFTAANGDQLFSTFTGLGVPAGGTLSNIVETLTITGGTGRFAGAGGTLTVRRTIDLATGASSGSIEGRITMQH